MKKKIFDALKSKYTHVGVSDKAFDRVASYLEKMVTSESSDEDFNKAIEGAEILLIGFKSESDFKLEEYKKKNSSEKPKSESIKQEDSREKKLSQQGEQSEEIPVWAKAFTESIQNLAKELASIKATNVAQTRKQLLEQRLKDVPEKLKLKVIKDFERMQFPDEDSFNAYADETEAELKDFIQLNTEQSLSANGAPFLASGSGGKLGDSEISPMMKSFIANRAKVVEKTAKA